MSDPPLLPREPFKAPNATNAKAKKSLLKMPSRAKHLHTVTSGLLPFIPPFLNGLQHCVPGTGGLEHGACSVDLRLGDAPASAL